MRVARWQLAFAVASIAACGGGGGGGSASGGGTTTPTGPTTTVSPTPPPTSGSGPRVQVIATPRAGQAPLNVSFDLCQSRDGSGGTALTYLASFEGEALATVAGCGFSHRYTSNGVSVSDTQLCVQDSAARRDCQTVSIKAYIDLSISVDRTTGCQATVVATANEVRSASGGFVALAELDKVMFEAFTVTGRSLGTREGTQSGTTWRSGTWNVNNQEKLRVTATGSARGVTGDDVPEGERPACGS